jgi:hypothetical protein
MSENYTRMTGLLFRMGFYHRMGFYSVGGFIPLEKEKY